MEGKDFICRNCGATSYVVLKDDIYCSVCGKRSNDVSNASSQINDSPKKIGDIPISELVENIDTNNILPTTTSPQKTEPTAILTGPANLFVTITPSTNNNDDVGGAEDNKPVSITDNDIDPYLITVPIGQISQNEGTSSKAETLEAPSESLADLLEMTLNEIDVQKEVQVIESKIETSEEISKKIDNQTKPLDEASIYARTVFRDINNELKTETKNNPPTAVVPDTKVKEPTTTDVANEELITLREEKELEHYAQNFIDSSTINDNPTPLGPKNIIDGIAINQHYVGTKEPAKEAAQAETPKTENDKPNNYVIQKNKKTRKAAGKKKSLKSRRHFWLSFFIIFISVILIIAGAFYVYYKSNTPPPKYDLTAATSKLSFELKKPDYIPEGYSPRTSYGDEEKYVMKYYYLPKYQDEKEDMVITQEKTSIENSDTLYTNLKGDKTADNLWSSVKERDTWYYHVKGKIVFIRNKKLFTITGNSLDESELQKIAFSIK